MKCLACDAILSDFEATRKYSNGEFLDLCNTCYYTISDQINVQERDDLKEYEDITDMENEDD